MSRSPDIKLVRNLAGESYFELEGTSTYVSMGHMEKLSTTANATDEDIFSAIGGARVVSDTDVTEVSVSGSAVLRQTGARELAYAMLAKAGSLTQAAATGIIKSGTAKAGDVIDFGKLDVTITSAGNLEEGEDYHLDAGAGVLTFLVNTPYDITASCAAIVAADDRAIVEALSARQGIRGRLLVVQRQARGGVRFKYTAKIVMFPDGEAMLHDDSGAKNTVPVRFKVVEDTTAPASRRFGYLQQLKAVQ
ncbi:hypothetical protein [Paracoccus sp. SSK6]|uniref:hypothetical protein n=1 Tax=Paracoccus sp. SSK6 TaxID=3143131 RepID=UPI003219B939